MITPEFAPQRQCNWQCSFEPKDGDVLTGAKFVVKTLMNQEKDAERQGDALGRHSPARRQAAFCHCFAMPGRSSRMKAALR